MRHRAGIGFGRRSRVVVHPHRRAPRRAVIGRPAHHNVGIVVLVDGLLGVDQVDAVVERPTGRVPYYSGLSVDRASVLRRDKVEAAHVGRCHGDGCAETARAQAICVYIGKDRRGTLPTGRALIGHDNFAAVRPRPNSDTAETAASGRDRLLARRKVPKYRDR